MLDLAVPVQATLDVDILVCDLRFLFKINPDQGIAGIFSVPLPRPSHDVTLARIEFHSQGTSPVNQCIKIFLQK